MIVRLRNDTDSGTAVKVIAPDSRVGCYPNVAFRGLIKVPGRFRIESVDRRESPGYSVIETCTVAGSYPGLSIGITPDGERHFCASLHIVVVIKGAELVSVIEKHPIAAPNPNPAESVLTATPDLHAHKPFIIGVYYMKIMFARNKIQRGKQKQPDNKTTSPGHDMTVRNLDLL